MSMHPWAASFDFGKYFDQVEDLMKNFEVDSTSSADRRFTRAFRDLGDRLAELKAISIANQIPDPLPAEASVNRSIVAEGHLSGEPVVEAIEAVQPVEPKALPPASVTSASVGVPGIVENVLSVS
jgi:hypothetical protein